MKTMIRYLCVECGQGGASGRDHHDSPPSYHCHRCEGNDTMWPEPQAKVYLAATQENRALKEELSVARVRIRGFEAERALYKQKLESARQAVPKQE